MSESERECRVQWLLAERIYVTLLRAAELSDLLLDGLFDPQPATAANDRTKHIG